MTQCKELSSSHLTNIAVVTILEDYILPLSELSCKEVPPPLRDLYSVLGTFRHEYI